MLMGQEGSLTMERVREYMENRMVEQNHEDLLVQLEEAMTQSSFGHEYALLNLAEIDSYAQKQALLAQMEEYKKTYFLARERLLEINPEKLLHLEQDLRYQKEVILRGEETLH